MLIEAAGGTVLLHDPGAPNLKVTTPLDLRVAELLLPSASRPTRAGQQHVDQRRGEGDLADAERGAEVDRPEGQGGEDADEEPAARMSS